MFNLSSKRTIQRLDCNQSIHPLVTKKKLESLQANIRRSCQVTAHRAQISENVHVEAAFGDEVLIIQVGIRHSRHSGNFLFACRPVYERRI